MGTDRTVLSLFDYSGVWGCAFLEQAEVVLVDSAFKAGWSRRRGRGRAGQEELRPHLLGMELDHGPFSQGELDGHLSARGLPPVVGVLAAPPCDCFTKASAQWWPTMDDDGRTSAGLRMVDTSLMVAMKELKFWCIENPPGRLWKKSGGGLRQSELGDLAGQYRPCEFGSRLEDTKTTYLWGEFVMPDPTRRQWGPTRYRSDKPAGQRDPIARSSSSQKRVRARTPDGFARAFAAANRLEK